MMRKPFIPAGKRLLPPRVVDAPEPGYFKVRLVKGGPWVPARVHHEPSRDPLTNEPLDRSWWWSAEIDGVPQGGPAMVPSHHVERVWTSGERITEAEFYAISDARFAPDAPISSAPLDLKTAPSLL